MMRRGSLLAAICAVGLPSAVQGQPARIAPADAPSTLQLSASGEPGSPLELRLRLVDAQTGRAIARAGLYVYQTDTEGRYTIEDPGNNRDPRIRGWLRSDAGGSAIVRTILPGHYPSSRVPRHVHFIANADGYAERVFEIVFDGDEFLDARQYGEAERSLSGFELCRPATVASMERCEVEVELAARR